MRGVKKRKHLGERGEEKTWILCERGEESMDSM
mgnify:CR=1 FL=1